MTQPMLRDDDVEEQAVAPVEHVSLSDPEFKTQLAQVIPHLRAFGRSLSGSRDLADDLVQETLLKAWAARQRFQAGTNMRAWTFIILRNLRLFFFSNYEGKPAAFVADDLARRLDEYESTRKQMRFESITGSIAALIDAKSVQGAAAMGIAAGLAGGPLVGVTSAALVEVSGALLEFAKKQFAIKEFEKNHSLAYLIQARDAAP